jgi:hypothetical protein
MQVHKTKTSKPHVLAAERDSCGLNLNGMGRSKDLYQEFLDYLGQESWYFSGGQPRSDPRTFWFRVPYLLYREWLWWWNNGWPKKRKLAGVQELSEESVPWDECIGCLLSNEDNAMSAPRRPGDPHRLGCLYREPGTVHPDDWRVSRLVDALRKQEENQ